MKFSETYYKHLTPYQHKINNNWFINQLKMLKGNGVLIVPSINKKFDKQGKEIK
tara:strand:- start:102 stop:263 length:162 start_codon:yes stop_codon:yes gene_type:complete